MNARTIAQTIPATVVPVRYQVTFCDSATPIDFGSDRGALVSWVTERTDALGERVVLRVARAEASDLVARAEAEGSAEGSTRGMAYLVEAWQHAVSQGEADDARAYVLSIAPVGTPVVAGDAMNRNVEYVGRIAQHDADTLRVEWVDGSSTEGAPLDMARMLTISTEPTVARAERAMAEAEADRITEAARAAHLDRHPEHAANFDAEPIVADIPARVTRSDSHTARMLAGDLIGAHRFAFRTTSIRGRRAPVTAVVDPGWTPFEAADRALTYVTGTLAVSPAIALAAMLAAIAEVDQAWTNAGPIADLVTGVEVWCAAVPASN